MSAPLPPGRVRPAFSPERRDEVIARLIAERDEARAQVQRCAEVAEHLTYYGDKTDGGTASYGYNDAADRIRRALNPEHTAGT